MDSLQKKVKFLSYNGFNPPATTATIAYMVVENVVIFSATEQVVSGKTSTINAVEEIVRKICEVEGLDWKNCDFYDLQTSIGYPHHGEGYYCLDKLIFEEGKLFITNWEKVSSSYDLDRDESRREQTQAVLKLLSSGE